MVFKKAQPGEVLHFVPEELTILVTMSGDNGIRYVEPMNLTFDDNGNIETMYITYDALSEWTVSLGTIDNVATRLMGKKS